MMKFLRHAFTGADNQTWDIGRILWAKMCFVYCFVSGWHTYHTGIFDPQSWAIGAGTILAAGGGSLALKAKTEPQNAGNFSQPPSS